MQTKDTFEFVGALSDMAVNASNDDEDEGFCPSNRPVIAVACCSAGLV